MRTVARPCQRQLQRRCSHSSWATLRRPHRLHSGSAQPAASLAWRCRSAACRSGQPPSRSVLRQRWVVSPPLRPCCRGASALTQPRRCALSCTSMASACSRASGRLACAARAYARAHLLTSHSRSAETWPAAAGDEHVCRVQLSADSGQGSRAGKPWACQQRSACCRAGHPGRKPAPGPASRARLSCLGRHRLPVPAQCRARHLGGRACACTPAAGGRHQAQQARLAWAAPGHATSAGFARWCVLPASMPPTGDLPAQCSCCTLRMLAALPAPAGSRLQQLSGCSAGDASSPTSSCGLTSRSRGLSLASARPRSWSCRCPLPCWRWLPWPALGPTAWQPQLRPPQSRVSCWSAWPAQLPAPRSPCKTRRAAASPAGWALTAMSMPRVRPGSSPTKGTCSVLRKPLRAPHTWLAQAGTATLGPCSCTSIAVRSSCLW